MSITLFYLQKQGCTLFLFSIFPPSLLCQPVSVGDMYCFGNLLTFRVTWFTPEHLRQCGQCFTLQHMPRSFGWPFQRSDNLQKDWSTGIVLWCSCKFLHNTQYHQKNKIWNLFVCYYMIHKHERSTMNWTILCHCISEK